MSETAYQLFLNEKWNSGKRTEGRRYSSFIRDLAINLSYYSNAAYEKLRKIFTLPSVRSLRRYLAPVGCSSGILKNDLAQIKTEISEGTHGQDVTLSLDEMSIKKALCYDPQLKKYMGFTDFPDDKPFSRETDHQILATQVLVFYVVGLDGKWRSPVAYYITNHLTGLGQSKVLNDVIIACHEFNVNVKVVTFDGLAANLTMVNALGANIRIPQKPPKCVPSRRTNNTPEQMKIHRIKYAAMKTFFLHPKTKEDIYLMLDTCHMLKLARNLIAQTPKGIVIPGFPKPAKWSYITELFEYQSRLGFRLGNKLTKNHVDIGTHKMKVVLAAQVLSNSTADTLRHLREDLKHLNVNLREVRPLRNTAESSTRFSTS
ncbi:uncharacterized protein LOC130687810 [Daphnia carinata]|uniref:uncharacterized protein LOC130687810 n=1 Tax=Daphnia carinata TaxID=120202 RepID=UPI00257F63F1|nr:uncharacterized protein LOC130687810 [Daphnia carinata]